MSEEALTIDEIRSQYDAEWVLLDDPQADDQLKVLAGVVRFHSKDRDEAYRKADELDLKRFAVVYTGGIPEGMRFALKTPTPKALNSKAQRRAAHAGL